MGASGGIHFPCTFPVKVMGLNTEAFSAAVLSIFDWLMASRWSPGTKVSVFGDSRLERAP